MVHTRNVNMLGRLGKGM